MEYAAQLVAAFVTLAVLFFLLMKYRKQVSLFVLILIGGGLVFFAAVGVIATIGVFAYERYTERQCMTAHERQAKAQEAPNDYFGKQLREAAVAEAKRCAELATRKEAQKN